MKAIITLAVIFSFILNTSCISTTKIKTNKGVKIVVDNQYEGVGILPYQDNSVAFSSKKVVLEKQDCRPMYKTITRDQIMIAPFLAAFFLWPLWIWSFGYKNSYHFKYKCEM